MQNIQDARLLKTLLSKYKMLKIEGIIHNPAEATELVHDTNPTLLFIDFEKFDFLKHIQKPPFIVGIGMKTNAIMMRKFLINGMFDFIFLPISEESLNIIMSKIFNILKIHTYSMSEVTPSASESTPTYNAGKNSSTSRNNNLNYSYMYAFAGRNAQPVKIVYDEVLYMKKVANHVCIHTDKEKNVYLKITLKYFQERLPGHIFLKINQSTIINIEKIAKIIYPDKIVVGKDTLSVARSFRKLFKQRIYR